MSADAITGGFNTESKKIFYQCKGHNVANHRITDLFLSTCIRICSSCNLVLKPTGGGELFEAHRAIFLGKNRIQNEEASRILSTAVECTKCIHSIFFQSISGLGLFLFVCLFVLKSRLEVEETRPWALPS